MIIYRKCLFPVLTSVIVLVLTVFCSPLEAQSDFRSHMIEQEDLRYDYSVGANDVLEITVYGEEDLQQVVQVTTNGYITYPLLGRVKVVGMSVAQLEETIRTALSKEYIRNPQVRVFVREFSNIFVMGQVAGPGQYPYRGGVTVLQAITTAGGFTKYANPRKVRVVRDHGEGREVFVVNVSSITKGNGEKDILLQPGDTVVVPESFF